MSYVADPIWRKARKGHRCSADGCRRTIVVGERYQIRGGVFDGRWNNEKFCEECANLIDEFYSITGPGLLDDQTPWIEIPLYMRTP